MIEGLMVGESVAAIIEEVNPSVVKMMVSDSQSAINICLSEGGSWRTRHLRLRAAHAKQRFVKGDWILRHCPGLLMLADIGTKTLPSARLEDLKRKLGMKKRTRKEDEVAKNEEPKDRRGEDRNERMEEEEEEGASHGGSKKITEDVERALKVVILMALVRGVKGQEREEERGVWLQAFIIIFAVIGVTEMLRKVWRMLRGFGARREPEEEPLEAIEEPRAQNENRRVEGQRTQSEERRVEGQRTQSEERRLEEQRLKHEEEETQRAEGDWGTPIRQRREDGLSSRSPGESRRSLRSTPPRDQTPERRSGAGSWREPGSAASSGYSRNTGGAASGSHFRGSIPAMPVPPMPAPRGSTQSSPGSISRASFQIPPEPEQESPNRSGGE